MFMSATHMTLDVRIVVHKCIKTCGGGGVGGVTDSADVFPVLF